MPVIAALLCPNSVFADDIALSLSIEQSAGTMHVRLKNEGRDSARAVCLDGESLGQFAGICFEQPVPSGDIVELSVPSGRSDFSGAYIAEASATYLNEGTRLGVVHAELFTTAGGVRRILSLPCPQQRRSFRNRTEVSLERPASGERFRYRFLAPLQIGVAAAEEAGREATFRLYNRAPRFRTEGPSFFLVEDASAGDRRAGICQTMLKTLPPVQRASRYSSELVGVLGAAALIISFVLFFAARTSAASVAAVRWGFSLAICSLCNLGFRELGIIPDLLLPSVGGWEEVHRFPGGLARAVTVLLERLYFTGPDYEPFFRNAADALYSYMLFANFFVLFWVIRPEPRADKYWHLIVRCFSCSLFQPLARLISRAAGQAARERSYSPMLARAGLLSVLVKLFFLPLLWSWLLHDISHLQSLAHTKHWSFDAVCDALIDAVIFLDVLIFSAGYCLELPQLRNVIRSVEPSVLGWFVCLLCYPPFNQAFFPVFDVPLPVAAPAWTGWLKQLAHGIIVLLWAVYGWASIALGPKASNLTNRGTVESGPYRYIRHPAYAAKVGAWILGAIFLGQGYALNVLATVVVYSLRAVTEERHLRRDPEYVAYCERVRWRCIPGVL